ncbi:hypothetical protein TNIN_193701 [Trichonephila inaurata madagascariensis]|uniref:Uncharacterized protein n=1 Tax=Trichonephila inaurata madagascariensis TaxID=2747483 RepID=A0A8X6XKX0_9ARAC|nr:hypothetical protein TNIN_193701 [Trichonephila inaurata madagascariensis]
MCNRTKEEKIDNNQIVTRSTNHDDFNTYFELDQLSVLMKSRKPCDLAQLEARVKDCNPRGKGDLPQMASFEDEGVGRIR